MSKIFKSSIEGVYFFYCSGCEYTHWFSTTGKSPSNPNSLTSPIWNFNNDFEKPTVRASILVNGQYRCHSFITNGKIEYLLDSTHKLSGKTIDLEDFEW